MNPKIQQSGKEHSSTFTIWVWFIKTSLLKILLCVKIIIAGSLQLELEWDCSTSVFLGQRQSPAGVLKIKQNSRDWHRCFSLNFAKFIRAQMSTSDRKGLCWTIFLINCSLSAWNFMKQGRLMQVFSFELLNY